MDKHSGHSASLPKNSSPQPLEVRKAAFISSIGLSLAAMATHGYLYQHHLQLRYGRAAEDSLCNISSSLNCNAAAASSYSEFLGVPMAMWGLLANLGFLVFATLAYFSSEDSRPGSRVLVVATAAFIAMTSAVMGVITLLFLPSTCPFCVLTYLISFLMLGSAWFMFKGGRPLGAAITAPGSLSSLGRQLAFVSGPLFLLGFVFHSQLKAGVVGAGADQLESFMKAALMNWTQAPPRDITTTSPLVLGPDRDKARLTIVEFADFRCGHCRAAAPVLKSFVQANSDVRLEFQAYPLDGACNTNIPQGDGESCLLARVTFCGEKLTGKGWALSNFIFENQTRWRGSQAQAAFEEFASVAGTTAADLQSCTESAEMKSVIESQVRLATELGVQGTPTVFVNGRRLEGGHIMPILIEASRRVQR